MCHHWFVGQKFKLIINICVIFALWEKFLDLLIWGEKKFIKFPKFVSNNISPILFLLCSHKYEFESANHISWPNYQVLCFFWNFEMIESKVILIQTVSVFTSEQFFGTWRSKSGSDHRSYQRTLQWFYMQNKWFCVF